LTVQPVEGMRVALERRRVNIIARSMVDSGWEQSPSSPAMDMREDGKVCEVFFTLPEGISEESVRVTAAGSMLTLTMKDDEAGKSYMQRIRIPYGVERSDTIQTVISNDVLRVRICPAGG
jgi:HSP20 family molecular chaperone IbpA